MATHWDIFRGGQTVPSNERLSVSINAKNVLTLNNTHAASSATRKLFL